MRRVSHRAMNCDIELIDCGRSSESRLARATSWLDAFEARFSRFSVSSELSGLNRRSGRWPRVSPLLFELLSLSLELARRSDGLFDPTILRCLEEAGYDRSFEAVGGEQTSQILAGGFSWADVRTDPATRSVWLPPSTGIDLGGIAKGWAVDRLARYLRSDCLVNAGGDLYAAGTPEGGDAWLVGVQDPYEPERDVMTLAVRDRGVATSSQLKRRWLSSGLEANHLIDPRTQAPTESDVVQVTAVAATATLAECHSKVALLLGASAGLDYLNHEPDVEGVIVAGSGRVRVTAGLQGPDLLSELPYEVAV